MGFGWKFHLIGILVTVATAWAQGPETYRDIDSELTQRAFGTQYMEKQGQEVCGGSSVETAMRAFKSGNSNVAVRVKRDLLVDYAVGVARVFSDRRTGMQVQDMAAGRSKIPLPKCNRDDDPSCSGVVDLYRLAAVGQEVPDMDWCAAFLSTAVNLIDAQAGGKPPNVVHDEDGSHSRHFLSARKLLDVFDSKSPPDPGAWVPGEKHPKKQTDAFIPADQPPIPGCMGIYKDDIPGHPNGHVVLVISVSGNSMSTIEGNSAPKKDSNERGIFRNSTSRKWGKDSSYDETDSKGVGHHMVYRGCVLPWPEMKELSQGNVCDQGVVDARLKAYDYTGFTQAPYSKPQLPSNAGGAEDFLRGWFQ